MLNFITQQRRGTTEEWARSTVIPQAGEFVIEERKNAPIRIKLGDGVHLFKDLQYIDESTVDALTELEARYNAHIAYVEGNDPIPENTLATEVIDARYIDGTNYTSLNEAIQSVSDKRVGGMVYDYDGELGLRQPYMLYLTDKDNNIIEETGVRIISGASGGGGTGGGSASTNILKIGYITTSPLVVTPQDKAVLKFTFSGTDSSGDAILQASATWRADGQIISYSTVKDGENEFDVTKYIKLGTTKILLTVVDDAGSVVTKNWSIQQLDVRLESNFNDKVTYPIDNIVFDYIPYGAVDKKIYFYLDGQLLTTIDSPAKLSGNTVRYELPKQEHGAHLLDMYMEAIINDNKITSNHVYKDIIWYDPTSTHPVIATTSQNFIAKQYDTTNIEYTVYDPNDETPEVIISVDDEVVSTVTLTNPTNIFAYNTKDIGTHIIKLTCKDVVKTLTATIEKLEIDVEPVTVGLAFDFNPVGKSNDDSNRLWSDGDITMSVSDNFDWVNGGYKQDENGDTYFCVKSGTTATINYDLFGDDAKKTGKEMKLVFKSTNVSNPDATIMSCLDNTTDKDHIGIRMNVHSANIYGQNGNLELSYSENDIIEFEFNISAATETVPMIMGYEDGVSTRPMVYDSTYTFKQNTPKPVTFGSTDCDVHIYRMKAYNTSLTNVDILNNFITDARTTTEMRARYTRNQIYDENQNLTPDVLAEKCPWLHVYKVSAPHFTNNKSDKVKGTTIQQLYKGGDPVLDNWTAHNAQHSGQGTSSNNYGAAGRNLDFIMNKDGCYIELGDGTTTDKITLSRTSVPVAYLNAKVNIASSNNLTNAMLANRYNRFNPYRRPFVREEGTNLDYIKDTMEFYNCVIFIQETDPDLTTHREFADTDWHFYAIGNIGDSKKTDKTRTTDMNDEYECCVEIMDVNLPLSAFPRDTMIDAMGYTVDEKTEEKIYTWAKDENLGILYEKQDDGTYVLTEDTKVNLNKTYYVDILENDDFSEDYTYGWRYLYDEDDASIAAACKQKWIEFYRFVTTSTDEDFKANLGNYFVVDSALYYYLFTTRYCMVDNRAKNTFWHYSKTADGTRKWDLCWDYDNDTSLGLNNYGKQVYRYGLEDIDKDAANEEVFRQSDSLFFCRIRDVFGPELKAMYKTLESQNAWKAETLINEADEWQNQFPEELWRLDIERKYIRTYTNSFIDGKGDSQFLVNMANGKMKYHRRQWERNQEQYMASKYQTTTASGDNYHANFRFGKPVTEDVSVKPNYELTLTPYSYMYLNVQYGDTTPISVRATPNVPTKVPYSGKEADIVNVYSAASIRDFGDLSSCYPKTVSIGNATRVKKLKIGNDAADYDNAAFTTLTTGSNPLLEEINVENISSLNQSLDLGKLTNLKKIYAFGTQTPSVIFAEGGKLEFAELPALNSLTLKNLMYLKTENLVLEHFDNVVELTVDSCPQIDSMQLVTTCKNLRRARLIDLNISTTYEFFEQNIFKLKGLNTNNEETPNAWLTGTAKFEHLTGSQLNELTTRYPNLNIRYENLTCTIQFKLDEESDPVYTQTVYSKNNALINVADPVDLDLIETPTKDSTVSHEFTYAGWSESTDGVPVDPSPLTQVAKDLVLYPTFTASVRKYEVTFYNNDGSLLNTYYVDYGTTMFNYPEEPPKKALVNNPDAYIFKSWDPEPVNIVGPVSCYATYELDPSAIYTIKIEDITYTTDEENRTLCITGYNNDNKIIRIPETFVINDLDYTVTCVKGTGIYPSTYVAAFKEKNLEHVILPDTLEHIGKFAFSYNPMLTEITIPVNVKELDHGAFAQCDGLIDIYYNAKKAVAVRDSNYTNDPYVFTHSKLGYNVHIGPEVEIVPSRVFTQSSKVSNALAAKKVIFEDGSICQTVDAYAFQKTDITEIELPTSIRKLAANAFSETPLQSIIVTDGTQTIEGSCFEKCEELQYVYIPKSVTTIASTAFRYSLSADFEIEEGSKFVWKNNCFINTQNNSIVFGRAGCIFPNDYNITLIEDYAFDQVGLEGEIVLPETLITVGQSSFYTNTGITSIVFPVTLTRVSNFGFYKCSPNPLNLPPNLQIIEAYSFVDNNSIEQLIIPESVRHISTECFRGCPNMTYVKFETINFTASKPADNTPHKTFLRNKNLTRIDVAWPTTIDGKVGEYTQDAPWGAGTDDSGKLVNAVTVKYTDKTLVYNIDGTITEVTEEEGA